MYTFSITNHHPLTIQVPSEGASDSLNTQLCQLEVIYIMTSNNYAYV